MRKQPQTRASQGQQERGPCVAHGSAGAVAPEACVGHHPRELPRHLARNRKRGAVLWSQGKLRFWASCVMEPGFLQPAHHQRPALWPRLPRAPSTTMSSGPLLHSTRVMRVSASQLVRGCNARWGMWWPRHEQKPPSPDPLGNGSGMFGLVEALS